MSINQKLGWAFGVVFVSILIMGYVLWWALGELSWARQRIDFSYAYAVTVGKLDSQISRQMKEAFSIILVGDKEQEEEFKAIQKTVLKSFDEWETLLHDELQFLKTKSSDDDIAEQIHEEEAELNDLAEVRAV